MKEEEKLINKEGNGQEYFASPHRGVSMHECFQWAGPTHGLGSRGREGRTKNGRSGVRIHAEKVIGMVQVPKRQVSEC